MIFHPRIYLQSRVVLLVVIENQVAMNLVGNQHQLMPFAEVNHTLQLVHGPHSAHRIMWIAEKKNFRVTRNTLFQGVPVKSVKSIFIA